ncbi:MAG TPA: helix-turn-helix domain-containing protein [Chthoniobacterales bacterium]
MPTILDCKPLLNDWFPGSFPKLPYRSDPAPEPLPDGLLNVEQAAKYVQCHPDTLRKWVKRGVFPHIPLPGSGSDVRFSRALIDEWSRLRALGLRRSERQNGKTR